MAGSSSPPVPNAESNGTSTNFSLATGDNGQGLRLGGGQGLVRDGVRASGLTEEELRLFQMHTQDSNPYANLVANGSGEYLNAQDYWNMARNQADSDLTARIQDNYTREAARMNAQRQAEAAQASTTNSQRETDNRTLWREAEAQYKSAGPTTSANTGAGFTEGSGGAAVGYLRSGRRADPTAIARLDARISKAVEDLEDYAVETRNPALYVAAGYLPRSSGEIVLGATLGPIAGRTIGAGVRALNTAAAGTFLTADLGAVASRALNEVVEFGAERLGRLNEGLGLQPALVENTGVRVANAATTSLTTAEKGLLGEAAAQRTLSRAGYQELPARLSSNNGFDGVFVKYGTDTSPVDIIISESKFSSTGRASLSNTNMGRQMSPEWVDANIQKMMNSTNSSVAETGFLLDANRSIIRSKVNVLNPQGINRWNVLDLPR